VICAGCHQADTEAVKHLLRGLWGRSEDGVADSRGIIFFSTSKKSGQSSAHVWVVRLVVQLIKQAQCPCHLRPNRQIRRYARPG